MANKRCSRHLGLWFELGTQFDCHNYRSASFFVHPKNRTLYLFWIGRVRSEKKKCGFSHVLDGDQAWFEKRGDSIENLFSLF